MVRRNFKTLFASLAKWLALCFVALVAACSNTKHTLSPLTPIPESAISIAQAWRASVDGADFPSQMSLYRQQVAVAGENSIAVLDATTGKDLSRIKIKETLSSGVGYDGTLVAVTTTQNELIVLRRDGVELWRQKMLSRVYTAPLLAGGRVFVLAGDRSTQAFDAATGAKLWVLPRPSEALTLSQTGSLGVYRDTLLVGGSGHLLGVNPNNGQVVWDILVGTNRATNDIERLTDLVGIPNRVGDSVCVRSYQTSVACVDASKGLLAWSKPTQGSVGVSGDATMLVSTESDGRVKAWNRATGDSLWIIDKLAHRGLSAPLLVGNSVVVGDVQGYVHVMSKVDGRFTARFSTDGSAIQSAPIVSGQSVMVLTTKGGVYAYAPQ